MLGVIIELENKAISPTTSSERFVAITADEDVISISIRTDNDGIAVPAAVEDHGSRSAIVIRTVDDFVDTGEVQPEFKIITNQTAGMPDDAFALACHPDIDISRILRRECKRVES